MDPSFLILIGFFVLMWLVVLRPQQKRQKERTRMLNALAVGDDVITAGGIHGSVVALTDETVDLQVTDDVVLRFQRGSIAQVLQDELDQADLGTESS